MKASVLIQARVSSSRLPAKVLLPVAGMPIFEVAYRRLANTGLPVTLCTSREKSDDILAREVEGRKMDLFRGDLDNVLGRFAAACDGRPDDTVVIRATSDNVFPDGAFVEALLSEFDARGGGYLYANGEESDLPDGLKVELFYLRDLRAADKETDSPYDREHVTPWIIRKYGENRSERWQGRGWGELRATVDTLEDYLRIDAVFNRVPRAEVLTVGHETLCALLAEGDG